MKTNVKRKILLIEDDVNLGYLIEQVLNKEGYSTQRVKRGGEGIIEASKNLYSLIIVDIGLPDISGFEVIEKIREDDISIPIIVITDRIDENNEISSFKKKATIFHKKPMNFELLVAQIGSLIRDKSQLSDIDKYGFTISPSYQTISNAKTIIQLSRSEYTLLELFISADYKIFTRADILNRVMDRNKNLSDNAVDTLISRLRRKLTQLGHGKFLITVHNTGYKINPIYRDLTPFRES